MRPLRWVRFCVVFMLRRYRLPAHQECKYKVAFDMHRGPNLQPSPVANLTAGKRLLP